MLKHMSDVGKMQRIQQLRQEIEENEFEPPSGTQNIIDKINGIFKQTQKDSDKARNDMTKVERKEAIEI